jgi:prepilin peptidase CpaA
LWNYLPDATIRWALEGYLVPPLLATLWIAWGDLKTRRIPNYLTFSAALAGLAFQAWSSGWAGLQDGFLGLALGLGLLIIPCILGGMGAGDVKALAALGAWLGPARTLHLFLYAAICGGLIALWVMLWKGILWAKIRREWDLLMGWLRYGPFGPSPAQVPKIHSIPYGVALALGMLVLVFRGA